MPRKFIKRLLPEHRTLLENRWLRPVRALLHDPAVIAPHRRSVARGLAVGLFWAFMPVPLQSVFAAMTCVWLRVNVLIAVAACWITNPFTAVPFIYAAHAVGAFLIGSSPMPLPSPETAEAATSAMPLIHLWQQFRALGEAFLLGSFVIALSAAALGYSLLNAFWLWSVRRAFARRRSAPRSVNPAARRP